MTSEHYRLERYKRENAIKSIGGLGEVVHTVTMYDERKHRHFIYEVTDNAIVIIRAYDDPSLIITKLIARPSRIKKYYPNAPQSLIEKSVEHTKMGLTF